MFDGRVIAAVPGLNLATLLGGPRGGTDAASIDCSLGGEFSFPLNGNGREYRFGRVAYREYNCIVLGHSWRHFYPAVRARGQAT